jgi:hypothetical protein
MNALSKNAAVTLKARYDNCSRGEVARYITVLIGLAGVNAGKADEATKPAADQRSTSVSALQNAVAPLAKNIKDFLDQMKQNSIAVGQFQSPPKLHASSGLAIAKALKVELKRFGVESFDKATYMVTGEYRLVNDDNGREVVKISSRIADQDALRLATDLEPRTITDKTTIEILKGGTTQILDIANQPPKAADKKDDGKELVKSAPVSSTPHIAAQTRVSAGPNSPYAIEVMVQSDGKYAPRKVEVDADGHAFVRLFQGEKYAVYAYNNSNLDAAVSLMIDGLNVFELSKVPGYDHWIVMPGTPLPILGWYLTNDLASEFEVVATSDPAVAQLLRSSSSLGTITATFAVAWKVGDPVPAGEENGKANEEPSQVPVRTVPGRDVKVRFEEVRRHVGRTRAVVSIRYDKTLDPKDLPTGSAPTATTPTATAPAETAALPTAPTPAPPR